METQAAGTPRRRKAAEPVPAPAKRRGKAADTQTQAATPASSRRKAAETPPAKPNRRASNKQPDPIGKQAQAAAAAEVQKPAPRRKGKVETQPAGSGRGRANGQKQADMSMSEALHRSRARMSGRDPDEGKQTQEAGTAERQDADTSGKAAGKETRGGTKGVLISVMPMVTRISRAPKPEEYPFGELTPAKKVKGEIVGPSFFIPDEDKADDRLASGRKRHKEAGKVFWSRKTTERVNGEGPLVTGRRVWLAGGE
jgi:hypothetical protein